MTKTPRPLPKAPPLHLTSGPSAANLSSRPLPTLPMQSACSSDTSMEGFCPLPPPTYPLPAGSSEPPLGPRPRLRISVTSPTLRRGNSLDSPTMRAPVIRNSGQALTPATDHRRLAPRNFKVFSRVSSANSTCSSLVFANRTATTELDAGKLEEDSRPAGPVRIPRLENGISNRFVALQLPQSRLALIMDRAGINPPVTSAKVETNFIGEEDDNNQTTDPNPYYVSSIDLASGCKFCTNHTKNWKSLLNATRAVMKFCLPLGPKLRSTKSCSAPATDAMRVSQLATPLHRTWYKERGGWRWVEKDVGEVLDELRKLQ